MVANRKVTGKASSMPGGLAVGGMASLAVTIIGAMISAALAGEGKIPETGIGYCSMGTLLAASFLGAFTAVKRIKHRRLYVCMLSGIVYYAILLGITALFFGGQYQGMGVTALVILAGCGTMALLGMKGERTPRRQKGKIKHR